MTTIRIALAQMRSEKGDWAGNLEQVESYMRQATARGSDVVVFPEMSLSGYCDPSRFPESVQTLDSPHMVRFVELTRRYGIAASAGFIEANPGGKPFITQVLAHDGRVAGVYRKVHVVDEEAAWFSPGTETAVFSLTLRGAEVRCGIAVCADSERPDLFDRMAEGGAQVVLHSSAPGLYGRRTDEASWWNGYNWYRSFLAGQLPLYARKNNLSIVVATQTGATVDEDFPGGSYVFGPDGSLLAATEDYSETMLVYDLPLEEARVNPT